MWYLFISIMFLEVSGGKDWMDKIFNTILDQFPRSDFLLDKPGSIVLNGEIINSYDITYHYCPGELIQMDCLPSNGWFVSKKRYIESFMEYMQLCFDVSTEESYFYRRMHLEKSKSNLICRFKNKETKEVRNLTVHFIKRNTLNMEYPKFIVNGLILLPRAEQSFDVKNIATDKNSSVRIEKKLSYLYEYYDREELNISMITHTRIQYNSNCTIDSDNTPNNNNYLLNKTKIKLTLQGEYTKIFCQVSSVINSASMTLVLWRDTFKYEPFISGLSLSNTLLKYKHNSTLTVIRTFSLKNHLTIKCLSEYSQPEIAFYPSEIGDTIHGTTINGSGYTLAEVSFSDDLDSTKSSQFEMSCSSSKNGKTYVTHLTIHRMQPKELFVNHGNEILIDSILIKSNKGTKSSGKMIKAETNNDYLTNNKVTVGSSRNKVENRNKIEHTTGNTINDTVTTESVKVDFIPTYQHDRTKLNIAIVLPCIIIIVTIAVTLLILSFRGKHKKITNETYEMTLVQQSSNNISATTGDEQDKSGPEQVYDIPYADRFINGRNEGSSNVREEKQPHLHNDTPYTAETWQKEIEEKPVMHYDTPYDLDSQPKEEEKQSHLHYDTPYTLENKQKVKEVKAYVHCDSSNASETIPEEEESKPYIHYDTPYDFRIFRLGVPVARIPDRFRRNCHRPRRFS